MSSILRRPLGLLLLCAGIGYSPSSAATHRVPSQFSTIQSAIDASVAADTVLVAAGTYTGDGNRDLDFRGINLLLLSESGSEQTTIDCGGSPHRALYFHHGETGASTVDGFTIKNSYAPGAIRCEGSSSPMVRNCALTRNTGTPNATGDVGAAISCYGPGGIVIESCLITNNDDTQPGFASVTLDGTSGALIENCTLTGNWGDAGGAIAGHQTTGTTIRGCILQGNQAASGAGIFLWASGTPPLVEECELTRNYAGDVGGISMDGGILRQCTITSNRATEDCGGADLSSCVVDRCIITLNCASSFSDVTISGDVQLTCSAIPDSGISIVGIGGHFEWTGPQVKGNPLFCNPAPCPSVFDGPSGDYYLRSDSPCLAQFSPCHQLIGYWDQGCSAPQPVGACCLSANNCVLTTQPDCAAQHGYYAGDGTSCYPTPCVIPVKVMTCGQIKSTFRGNP